MVHCHPLLPSLDSVEGGIFFSCFFTPDIKRSRRSIIEQTLQSYEMCLLPAAHLISILHAPFPPVKCMGFH